MKSNYKKPCFTERHYYILAGLIKEYEEEREFYHDSIPDNFFTKLCILLKEDNPNFKLKRFVKYSGKI